MARNQSARLTYPLATYQDFTCLLASIIFAKELSELTASARGAHARHP